jgi:hypothetical protein
MLRAAAVSPWVEFDGVPMVADPLFGVGDHRSA